MPVVSTLPLRVMIVDDHEVVRNGVKALLEEAGGMSVAGEAATVREAIERAEWARPDVVVMDVRLADGSGIEATREILSRLPKTQVLMLTTFADDEALFASIMAGAAGYVLKQIKGGDLIRAIRAVGAGENLLDPAVTKGLLDRLRKGKHLLQDERLARLSGQEERILGFIADGKTNKQIGDELHLAEKTVKNYVSSILARLEVARRAGAAAYLTRHTTSPGTACAKPLLRAEACDDTHASPVVLLVEPNERDRELYGAWLEDAGIAAINCPGPKVPGFGCLGTCGRP